MRIRSVIALSAVALTGVLLAGCSGGSPTAGPSPTVSLDLCASAAASGTASDSVTVKGDAGADPTVTFTSPLDVTSIERTVTTEGTGEKIAEGDYVQFAIAAYDAETGEKLGSAGYQAGSEQTLQVSAVGAGQYFGCATAGSRIVLALPGSEDVSGQINVIDVLKVIPAAQWCQPVAPTDGAAFPTVTFGEDGNPTVTIPQGDAPADVTLKVLTAGDGETVKSGDSVTVDYEGVSWSTGKTFDSSWDKGTPATFATTAVVAGFGNALVGQKVGSTVLVSMPPACGYGTDTANDQSGLAGQTLVFVIDIQATAPAK